MDKASEERDGLSSARQTFHVLFQMPRNVGGFSSWGDSFRGHYDLHQIILILKAFERSSQLRLDVLFLEDHVSDQQAFEIHQAFTLLGDDWATRWNIALPVSPGLFALSKGLSQTLDHLILHQEELPIPEHQWLGGEMIHSLSVACGSASCQEKDLQKVIPFMSAEALEQAIVEMQIRLSKLEESLQINPTEDKVRNPRLGDSFWNFKKEKALNHRALLTLLIQSVDQRWHSSKPL